MRRTLVRLFSHRWQRRWAAAISHDHGVTKVLSQSIVAFTPHWLLPFW